MLVALLLVIAVSCGGTATSTAAPPPTAVPVAVVGATAVPVAPPTATKAPAATVQPSGSLNLALTAIGIYEGNTKLARFPQTNIIGLGAMESLVRLDVNAEYEGELAESWSVAPDNVTWTFNLNKGVQFHGGWGEFTAHDLVWSLEMATEEGTFNDTARQGRRIFFNPAGGYTKALDDYTIEVNTGVPAWDVLTWVIQPGPDAVAWGISKKQWDELVPQVGEDEANRQTVGTGPWEMVENRTTEFWKFKAVPNHYLKTPFFEEMTIFEIPEKSTTIANFQVGKLDVYGASPDEVPTLAELPGTKFMIQEGSSHSFLRVYGQFYEGAGTADEHPSYNRDLPYVSSNPDFNSPEWKNAAKVRKAIGLAIDRQKIIDLLLNGEGEQVPMYGWTPVAAPDHPEWTWEYDIERSKQLLKEAGYEDGFEFELVPAIRNAPAEVEACEAVADMLADVGITARLQKIPFGVLFERVSALTFSGIVCHAVYPLPEPVYFMNFDLTSGGKFHSVDHPWLAEHVKAANETFDAEERWRLTTEIGQFIWDNSMSIGLYTQNNTYPLGPKVDSWAEHLERGDPRRISALEWAPHRK